MTQLYKTPFNPEAYHRFYSVFDSYNRNLIAVAKSLLNFQPKRILDLACGTGLSTAALRTNFIDVSILG